jgi:hypothetical protein
MLVWAAHCAKYLFFKVFGIDSIQGFDFEQYARF